MENNISNRRLYNLYNLKEYLNCKINIYTEKKSYSWLVSIFEYALEIANCIEDDLIQILKEKSEAFNKGYQVGYKECEKKYCQFYNNNQLKNEIRDESIRKLKEDMPHLF